MKSKEREVLKLALEALEMFCEHGAILRPIETRDAIKEALAQPEQEPFAWADLNALSEQINSVNCGTVYRLPCDEENRQALYTAPTQRKSLTDEEIVKIWESRPYFNDFARAIEAAHGIKE